ncbi:TPA: hypothetical protein N0F65_002660 [Lagenidium giganteum]|uniref:Reverse transcriptase domain-containing protein n=1 Tax=Lagenidium giganteum TaxID=4803 RepID=A0AAV2Z5H3_9STRA|nr:TPA: hypothetical protein N0F65_002660 [Lagenidium giganteum]
MIALRVRGCLPTIVHHGQTGFAPHRTIHATVAMLRAFQDSTDSPTATTAADILLDFSKAYDSVDRAFIWNALQWIGFPPDIVDIVAAMHAHTTAVFLVNDHMSHPVRVSNDIRQGCPLPLHLALEPLYRKIELQHEYTGALIKHADSGWIDQRIP